MIGSIFVSFPDFQRLYAAICSWPHAKGRAVQPVPKLLCK